MRLLFVKRPELGRSLTSVTRFTTLAVIAHRRKDRWPVHGTSYEVSQERRRMIADLLDHLETRSTKHRPDGRSGEAPPEVAVTEHRLVVERRPYRPAVLGLPMCRSKRFSGVVG